MQIPGRCRGGNEKPGSGKLADYLRTHSFKTVAGPIAFGPEGEWTEARVLEVQFQGVQGHELDQFKDPKTEVILYPDAYKTGTLRFPYTDAKQ